MVAILSKMIDRTFEAFDSPVKAIKRFCNAISIKQAVPAQTLKFLRWDKLII